MRVRALTRRVLYIYVVHIKHIRVKVRTLGNAAGTGIFMACGFVLVMWAHRIETLWDKDAQAHARQNGRKTTEKYETAVCMYTTIRLPFPSASFTHALRARARVRLCVCAEEICVVRWR